MIVKSVGWTDALASRTHSLAILSIDAEAMDTLQKAFDVKFEPKFHVPSGLNSPAVDFPLSTAQGLKSFLASRPQPDSGARPYVAIFPLNGSFAAELTDHGHVRGESSRVLRDWTPA